MNIFKITTRHRGHETPELTCMNDIVVHVAMIVSPRSVNIELYFPFLGRDP